MAPVGFVYGTDKVGNYKVRSSDLPKPVVLRNSSGRGYSLNQKIDFEITAHGDHVDFAAEYHPLEESDKDSAKTPKGDIKLVLMDAYTRDILILGRSPVAPNLPIEHNLVRTGRICSMDYVLFKPEGAWDQEGFAQRLDINPDRIVLHSFSYNNGLGSRVPSVLPYVYAPSGDAYRTALEGHIQRQLYSQGMRDVKNALERSLSTEEPAALNPGTVDIRPGDIELILIGTETNHVLLIGDIPEPLARLANDLGTICDKDYARFGARYGTDGFSNLTSALGIEQDLHVQAQVSILAGMLAIPPNNIVLGSFKYANMRGSDCILTYGDAEPGNKIRTSLEETINNCLNTQS